MHSIQKKYCLTPFRVFSRQLRTCSVTLVPRGVANSERRPAGRINTEQEPAYDTLPSVDHTKFHKDTRPVDSVDPVILKYTNLLNDLAAKSGAKAPQEKVHLTNFGSIRFDNDNVPVVHGRYDTATASSDIGSGKGSVQYQKENAESKEIEATTQQLDDIPSQQYIPDFHESEILSNNESKSVIYEDEKAFDELFCGGVSENKLLLREDKVITGNDGGVNTVSTKDILNTCGSDFIDEQFFGSGNRVSDSTHHSSSVSFNSDHKNMDFTRTFDTQDLGRTNDLNYIDQTFFKPSSDTLRENRKPTAEYAEMKKDLQKAFDNMHEADSGISNPVKENIYQSKDNTQNIDRTNDLNYIDQTFFKTSLDTLGENRKPSAGYAEMEKDLQKAFDHLYDNERRISDPVNEKLYQSKEDTPSSMGHTARNQTANIALEYLGIDPSSVPPPKLSNQKKDVKKETSASDEALPKSAYDYVLKKRKELHNSEFGFGVEGEDPGSKSYQKILSLVRERTKDTYTKQEMLTMLKKSIIYNTHDIVGMYKPYGVAMHEGTQGMHHTLTDFLPQLAEYLKADDLYIVHRLDATSTGVLLLARTPAMADTLKDMFKNQKIKKTYWAITKGVPSPLQGIIDIPIAEGTVDGKYRMVLRPDVKGLRGSTDKSRRAVTGFKVISKAYNTALVELTPETGVKHQLRVHLGFGLSCPILGDHKYSHLKKMAPQRLPGDTLERFKLTQSKVRNMPMFLHSQSVIIPEIIDGRNIFIKAKVPAFFNKALSTLKLNTHRNQVRYRDSKPLDD